MHPDNPSWEIIVVSVEQCITSRSITVNGALRPIRDGVRQLEDSLLGPHGLQGELEVEYIKILPAKLDITVGERSPVIEVALQLTKARMRLLTFS